MREFDRLGLVWVGLGRAGLADESVVRVVDFPSLVAFKQRLRGHGGAVWEAS